MKTNSRICDRTVTEVFVKWPNGPGPVCILPGESIAVEPAGSVTARADGPGTRGAQRAPTVVPCPSYGAAARWTRPTHRRFPPVPRHYLIWA